VIHSKTVELYSRLPRGSHLGNLLMLVVRQSTKIDMRKAHIV